MICNLLLTSEHPSVFGNRILFLQEILFVFSLYLLRALCFVSFTVRPTLPVLAVEDQLPEHPSPPSNTDSLHHANSPGNKCSPTHVIDTNVLTHAHSPTHTDSHKYTSSPPHTHSSPVSQLMQPDWVLRDSPYSEGVAEHKRGKACWDCLRFHRDNNSELQVSLTSCMLREVFQSNLIAYNTGGC